MDCGFGQTSIVPCFEGHIFAHAVTVLEYGAYDMNHAFLETCEPAQIFEHLFMKQNIPYLIVSKIWNIVPQTDQLETELMIIEILKNIVIAGVCVCFFEIQSGAHVCVCAKVEIV